jgi:catechol 2,3-dioxygenase-like lactoylglutathione lyase family enzyme
MSMISCYPVLMTRDVAQSADFFRTHFGFQTTFLADWYVSLKHDGGELALLDYRHPTVPEGFGAEAAGALVNVEVDNVDELYRRLVLDGPLDAVVELRSEAFGQRHFIVRGPSQTLVDVITEIEPDAEFGDSFIS